MSDLHKNILLILDDREFAGGEVRTVVGTRRYGDIIYKRRAVVEHFRAALPEWARARLIHLRGPDELAKVRTALEAGGEDMRLCLIAGRAGFVEAARLFQLVERLPYAEEDFTDRLYNPLLVFLHDAHALVGQWAEFEAMPMHLWNRSWQGCQRVQSVAPLDLSLIRDFLAFISGSTATRHFNEVAIDAYYYTKRSTDKRKMRAEYGFYGLVPEGMRPWLIQPFDFQEDGERASYKMMRYYLADAALQWVHDAFDADTFAPFVERLMFFLSVRPARPCAREQSAALARELFIAKVEARVKQFLASDEGRRINAVAASATSKLDISQQLARYLKLYARHEKGFAFDHMAVGHGDPCFSNVLYDRAVDPPAVRPVQDLAQRARRLRLHQQRLVRGRVHRPQRSGAAPEPRQARRPEDAVPRSGEKSRLFGTDHAPGRSVAVPVHAPPAYRLPEQGVGLPAQGEPDSRRG
jgi:hypothetical protein